MSASLWNSTATVSNDQGSLTDIWAIIIIYNLDRDFWYDAFVTKSDMEDSADTDKRDMKKLIII